MLSRTGRNLVFFFVLIGSAGCNTPQLENIAKKNPEPKQSDQKEEIIPCDHSILKGANIIIPEGFSETNILKKVKPEYPPIAKEKRIEGEVWVMCWINEEGKVKMACAQTGPVELRSSAEHSLREWQFKPHMFKNGKYYIQYGFTIRYILDKKKSEPIIK